MNAEKRFAELTENDEALRVTGVASEEKYSGAVIAKF